MTVFIRLINKRWQVFRTLPGFNWEKVDKKIFISVSQGMTVKT